MRHSRDIDPSKLMQLGQSLPEDKQVEAISAIATDSGSGNQKQDSKQVAVFLTFTSAAYISRV